jgi:hypothetical protein
MTFTDDDLKRLKDYIRDDEAQSGIRFAIPINVGKCKALLARLEAAEKALEGYISLEYERVNYDEVVQWTKAWRKAAGK